MQQQTHYNIECIQTDIIHEIYKFMGDAVVGQ